MRSAGWFFGASVLLLSIVVSGCSAAGSSDGDGPGSGGSSGSSGGAGTAAAGGASGTGGTGAGTGLGTGGTELNPDDACGYAQIPTVREPGGILIVFDQSTSMEEDSQDRRKADQGYDESSAKWTLTTTAVGQVLPTMPDDANVGLMLFPNTFNSDYCNPPAQAHVDVGPLSTTRPSISSYINPNASYGGSVTPLAQALQAGHDYMSSVQLPGKKAVLLVTDGAPSPACGMANQEVAQVAFNMVQQRGQPTFVVGLDGSATQLMSLTASNGDTGKAPDCNPTCCAGLACNDKATCCHYTAEGANTTSQLKDALEEITSKFLASCVFSVPKGQDPSKFDENLVNVVVSIEGGPDQTVPQDPNDGWSYVDGGNDKIEINGPVCDEILKKSSEVEILLGCPTEVR